MLSSTTRITPSLFLLVAAILMYFEEEVPSLAPGRMKGQLRCDRVELKCEMKVGLIFTMGARTSGGTERIAAAILMARFMAREALE